MNTSKQLLLSAGTGFATLVCLLPLAALAADLEFLNPEGLFAPSTYTQVVVTEGETTVYISGQTARDEKGNIVGAGDVRRQAEKVLANLRIAIEAAGGSMKDIVKITTYVVNLQPADRAWIGELVKRSFPRLPAHTLVGVSALAAPELLIEIEAVAVMD
jgi:enamine deaminase RidA (YjgF/YER057c/UK114 family)